MAASGAQRTFDLAAERRENVQRNKSLNGSGKAAAVHTVGTAAVQRTLCHGQGDRHGLFLHRTGGGNVLQLLPRGVTGLVDQSEEGIHIALCQRVRLLGYPLVVGQEV